MEYQDKALADFLRNLKTESINEKTPDEAMLFVKDFYYRHTSYIKKHMSCKERAWARGDVIFGIFNSKTPMDRPDVNKSPTRFKVGRGELLIPDDFNAVAEAILRNDLAASEGLFRRVPNFNVLKEAKDLVMEMTREGYPVSQIIESLGKYDVITLTSVFKGLFNFYKTKMFPDYYANVFASLGQGASLEEIKATVKFLVMALAPENRKIYEFLCTFVKFVTTITMMADPRCKLNMDSAGFSNVIVSKLFDQTLSFEQIGFVGRTFDFALNNFDFTVSLEHLYLN